MTTIITLDGGDAIVTHDGKTLVDTRPWHAAAATAITHALEGTEADIARLVGESPQNWHKYRGGDRSPTESKLEDWCASAGVRLELGPKGWRAWLL